MVEFIQAQNGLKFNKREISCRSDLEVAFYLLQKCEGNPATLDILSLAISVLTAYGWMIARPRKPSVDKLLILRGSPNDIVARKCSGCAKEYLDDPFAYWSKTDPACYIIWGRFRSSYGRPDCKMQNVNLLPQCKLIKYLRATKKDLEKQSLDQFGKWFLLPPPEFGELPLELEVKCQGKDCQETRTVRARWTAHTTPSFW